MGFVIQFPSLRPLTIIMLHLQGLLLISLIFASIHPSLTWSLLHNVVNPLSNMGQLAPHFDNEPIPTLHQNDALIADTITSFIFSRLQNGHFHNPTGWGFRYSTPPKNLIPDSFPDSHQLPLPRNAWNLLHIQLWGSSTTSVDTRWTPFDQHGSNLYIQRSRFPYFSQLIQQNLEEYGFAVHFLELFYNQRGIYIKWDVVDPTEWMYAWDDGWKWFENTLFSSTARKRRSVRGWYDGGRNFEGEKAQNSEDYWWDGGEEDEMCGLRGFFNDPLQYFRCC